MFYDLDNHAARMPSLAHEALEEALLRTVLRVDPYRERSYRALMTLLAEQGRRAEALVLYQQLEELLRVQFASPAPETQALASRIGQALS